MQSIAHVGGPLVTVPLLAASTLRDTGLIVLTVNRRSPIQQLVPAHALCCIAASQQVVVTATVPSRRGQPLREVVGLRVTVGVAAVGAGSISGALESTPV